QRRQYFREPSERPDVVLVAKGGEEALPQSLFPSGDTRAGGEDRSLRLQPNDGGLPEQFTQRRLFNLAQRRATTSAQFRRPFARGVATEPCVEFGQRRIEHVG